jgi:hypothetical protein
LSATYEDKMDTLLTHDDVVTLLEYNRDTGHFQWKKKRRGIKTGVNLGTDNGFGYLRITVLGKSFYAHRLAWFYCHKVFPKGEIDHINGNKQDNRIENLRDVTPQANAQNKVAATSKSKTQMLGVSWHKKAKKWQAHICVYKQRKYLGLFDNIQDAQQTYLNERKAIVYVSA